MAEKSADPLLKFEQQLTCPVCLELFRNPKALPCHHTYCQDCLEKSLQELKDRKCFLKCPSCREPALLPDGGVPALPPAFTINSFLELHQELLVKQDTMECGQHKKPLELFCSTCQKPVCMVCTVHSHKNHDYHLISDIIHNCKQQLKECVQPVKRQLAAITDAVKVLEKRDEEITKQEEATEQQIHSQAQEAKAIVDQAKKMLIQEVHIAAQQKKHVLSLQKEEGKSELARLQSSLEFVEHSLAVLPDQQIVASKQAVLDGLNKAISQQEDAKFNPAEYADIKFKENVGILKHCKNIGVLECSFVHKKCRLTSRSVAAGREACCELRVQHKDGSPLSISTSLITYELTASRDPQPTDCTIRETGPGKYAISYTPISRSPHQLKVMVGGAEIPGSVFSLPVLPPTPETRGQPLHVIVKGLEVPIGVAMTRSGQVIVSEFDNHCIKIFSNEFRLVKSIGSQGSGYNQFYHPDGLAVTSDGRILVADSSNNRIQVLTSDGQFLECIGSASSGLPHHFPTRIVVHPSGQILVSEGVRNRIRVFDSDLTLSHSFGCYGSQQGKFSFPRGMAVDSQGIVYIADYGNSRIQKFTISGKYQAQFGSQGHKDGQLFGPVDIAIDANDLVYVSEKGNSRISIFTTTGNFIKSFGREDQEHDVLIYPSGLVLDKIGNLYVCDSELGQLVLF